jgi:hypothetical protein
MHIRDTDLQRPHDIMHRYFDEAARDRDPERAARWAEAARNMAGVLHELLAAQAESRR